MYIYVEDDRMIGEEEYKRMLNYVDPFILVSKDGSLLAIAENSEEVAKGIIGYICDAFGEDVANMIEGIMVANVIRSFRDKYNPDWNRIKVNVNSGTFIDINSANSDYKITIRIKSCPEGTVITEQYRNRIHNKDEIFINYERPIKDGDILDLSVFNTNACDLFIFIIRKILELGKGKKLDQFANINIANELYRFISNSQISSTDIEMENNGVLFNINIQKAVRGYSNVTFAPDIEKFLNSKTTPILNTFGPFKITEDDENSLSSLFNKEANLILDKLHVEECYQRGDSSKFPDIVSIMSKFAEFALNRAVDDFFSRGFEQNVFRMISRALNNTKDEVCKNREDIFKGFNDLLNSTDDDENKGDA